MPVSMHSVIERPFPKVKVDHFLRSCENVFDDKHYDAVLAIAQFYFGKDRVSWDNKEFRWIRIKDRVNIELSLSYNETKAYIYTYFGDKGGPLGEHYTPRLFAVSEMAEYLRLQADINSWLIDNEGQLMTVEYKGYLIAYSNREYKIWESLSTGTLKMRRMSRGNKWTGKRDRFGNKLYYAFQTAGEVLANAQNYIDNHIVPWESKQIGKV